MDKKELENMKAELNKLNEIKQQIVLEHSERIRVLRCKKCKAIIEGDYYRCQFHEQIFCSTCVIGKGYGKEINAIDGILCKYFGKKVDCIHSKKFKEPIT
jgi:hypothetical protein